MNGTQRVEFGRLLAGIAQACDALRKMGDGWELDSDELARAYYDAATHLGYESGFDDATLGKTGGMILILKNFNE